MSTLSRPLLLALPLAAAACGDDPAAPRPIDQPGTVSVSAAVSLPPCTMHWVFASSGNWTDPARWSPAGVPDTSDVACIDAVGTYSVTIDTSDVRIDALVVGGRSVHATLVAPAGTGVLGAVASNGMELVAGSTLDLGQSLSFFTAAGPVYLGGDLVTRPGCGFAIFQGDSIQLLGAVDQQGTALAFEAVGGDLRIRGNLSVAGGGRMILGAGPGNIRLEAGSLTGAGTAWSVGQLHWSGGTLPPRANGQPRLTHWYSSVFLESDSLDGTLRLLADATPLASAAVHGNIGAGVHLVLGTDQRQAGVTVDDGSGGPLVNRGVLSLEAGADTITVSGAGLLNQGTLEVTSDSGLGILALDSTVNDGVMVLTGVAAWSGNLSFLRNRHLIGVGTAGRLTLTTADFIAEGGSVVVGPMTVDHAIVSGTGLVGDVTSVGGVFEPGAPIGALTVGRLTLDATSAVNIDVAGTASFDRLRVLTGVTYGGTLTLREVAPFASASCGQVLPILTDRATRPRGTFAKYVGLAPAFTRAWRVYNPTDTLFVVGHNPLVPVSASGAAVSVTEGGPSAGYSVCLRSAPTADVTIAPVSSLGQAAAAPALVFTSTAWALPSAVSVTAIDDLLYEPLPVVDDIQHAITSTDPQYQFAGLAAVAATVYDNDGSANLELTIVNPPPVVAVGGSFTLTLQVQDNGPDDAPAVSLNIPASAGYAFAGASGVLSCTSDATSGTTCQLGTIAAGASVVADLTFTAAVAGSYNTTYNTNSVQPDPNPANNSRPQVITIQ